MSLSYTFSGPSLQWVKTVYGMYVIKRNNDGSHTIWKAGKNLGSIRKVSENKWIVCGTDIIRTTRRKALDECLDKYYSDHPWEKAPIREYE